MDCVSLSHLSVPPRPSRPFLQVFSILILGSGVCLGSALLLLDQIQRGLPSPCPAIFTNTTLSDVGRVLRQHDSTSTAHLVSLLDTRLIPLLHSSVSWLSDILIQLHCWLIRMDREEMENMWAFTTSMLHYEKQWEERSDDKGGAGGYGKMVDVGQFMRTTHMQYKKQVPSWLDEAFRLALRVLAVFLVIGAMRWGHQEQEDPKTGEDSGRARETNYTSQCIAPKDDPFQIKEHSSGLTRSLPSNPGPAGRLPLSPSLSPPPPSPPRPPLSPPSPSPTQSSLDPPPQKSLRLPAKVLAVFLFAFGFALGGGLLCLDVGNKEMTITQFSSSSSSSFPSTSSSSLSSPSAFSLRSSSFTFSSLSSSFCLSSSFLSSFSHSSKDEQTDTLCPPLTIATSPMNLEGKEERQSSNLSWFAHVYHRWQGPQGGSGSPSFPPLLSTSSLTSSARASFIRSWRGSREGGREEGKEGGREEERGGRQNTLPPLLPKEGAVSLIDDGEGRVGLGSNNPPGREMERDR